MNVNRAREWVAEITKKSAIDFALLEFEDRLYWPDKISRLRGDGQHEETEVLLLVPDFFGIAKARLAAEEQLVELKLAKSSDREDLEAAKKAHEDLWTELDMFAQVAFALCTKAPPHGPLTSLHFLLQEKLCRIPRSEVFNVHRRVSIFAKLADSNIDEIDKATTIEFVHAVARVGHLGPLAAFSGSAQDALLTSTCVLLDAYLSSRPSEQSSGTSTRASSRRKS
jgi:hypothetical protein